MCFFFSLIPATFWVVVGYFVLYSSGKTEGFVSKFGRFLSIWIFFVALVILICGLYLTISGDCPLYRLFDCTKTILHGIPNDILLYVRSAVDLTSCVC